MAKTNTSRFRIEFRDCLTFASNVVGGEGGSDGGGEGGGDQQKRATLIAILRKVHKMASDDEQL